MEILHDFIQRDNLGLYCSYGNFYLDATKVVDINLVSHAHGDHCCSGCNVVYCTPPTQAFMEHRFGKQSKRSTFYCLDYGNTFRFGDVEVTFFPAGHMLGSAMILMFYKGVRYLYTGDYKLQADETCHPATLCEAEVLITESTFANPGVQHPMPQQEVEKLNQIEHNILLGTYSLGKAQRLTSLLNRFCPQKKVLLHYSILPYHHIYEKYADQHWLYQPYNRKYLKTALEETVYLVPPLTFHSYSFVKNSVKIFASGWDNLHTRNHTSFFISDHVDWNDILYTIGQVKPRQVWTVHGDGNYLASHYEGKILVKKIS